MAEIIEFPSLPRKANFIEDVRFIKTCLGAAANAAEPHNNDNLIRIHAVLVIVSILEKELQSLFP